MRDELHPKKRDKISFYVGNSSLLFLSGFLEHLCYLACVLGGVPSTSTACI